MSDITLSPAARLTLTALTSMQSQIGVVQNRLASGKRVNQPIDNPTSYFLAAGTRGPRQRHRCADERHHQRRKAR